jgi:capsular polysaccharide biosynthesis protein/MinD-like ATPase involved in chromosome partitioning or flagellar assembly
MSRILRRRWPQLVLITATVAIVAALVTSARPDTYQATAKLLLSNGAIVSTPPGTVVSGNVDPERDLNTKLGLIRIETVADAVDRRLRLGLGADALVKKVATTTEGTSDIIDVTVTDRRPERAAAIANAFATEYVAFRTAMARSTLRQAAASAQARLATLDPASRAGSALSKRLHDLQLAAVTQTGGAQLVQPAARPTAPSAPHPAQAGIVGAVVGLVLALVLITALELTERRVIDEDTLEAAFGLPVLAFVPRGRGRLRRALPVPGDELQSDGYGHLAGQLVVAARRRGIRALLVTSAGTGDGKTSITLGLARELALLGHRAVVIQADIATVGAGPPVTLAPARTLADVVIGDADPEAALVELDAATLQPFERPRPGRRGPSVSVLPAVKPGASGQPVSRLELGEVMRECFSRPEMVQLVRDCGALGGFVLVDAPPADMLRAAPALLESADAALVVCRIGWTGRQALQGALQSLRSLGLPALGLVVTAAGRRTTRSPAGLRRVRQPPVLELEPTAPAGGGLMSDDLTFRTRR